MRVPVILWHYLSPDQVPMTSNYKAPAETRTKSIGCAENSNNMVFFTVKKAKKIMSMNLGIQLQRTNFLGKIFLV